LFWAWLAMWPWMEVNAYLGERRLQRDGPNAWKPIQPLRDSALLGALAAPLITGLSLVQDLSVLEAIATGTACGAVIFGMTATMLSSMRRAHTWRSSERRSGS
jgi:hypothetical protein